MSGKATALDAQPLHGQKVLLLRPVGQHEALLASLRHLGAEALHVPVIELRPVEEWAELDAALQELPAYDWLLFTSANAVNPVVARAQAIGAALPKAQDVSPRVCVIGPATREAVERAGLPVHRMAERFIAEGVLEAFGDDDLSGKRLLLPRASAAREVIPEALRVKGMQVDAIPVYRNQVPPDAADKIADLLAGNWQPGWILFTSASTVKNLLAVGGRALTLGAKLASIGPATTEVMEKHGLPVALESDDHSANGLVDALLQATAEATRPKA